MICIHHIIHDGWSLNVLLKDLSYFYSAFTNNVLTSSSITPEFNYLKFIKGQRDSLTTEALKLQKIFWNKYLHRLPKLELVYDFIENKKKSPSIKRAFFKLNKQTTQQLKKLACNHHATLYEVLVTAFGIFLSQLSCQNDIHFVTAVSGRSQTNNYQTVGFFVNLLVIRFINNLNQTFNEQLKKNKVNLMSVLAHQDLPIANVLEALGDTVHSKMPLYAQAGFIFQSYPIFQLEINNSNCERAYSEDPAHLIYDDCTEVRFGNLICFMQEHKENIHGMFEYNDGLYHEKTIHAYIDAFTTLIKNIATNIETTIFSIPLLSTTQQQKLLFNWNKSVADSYPSSTILSEFSKQVSLLPNAIAVQDEYKSLTYSMLDGYSNYLAHDIASLNMKKEDSIGICVKKGCEQIIAIMSALKVGACYVPLDIELPYKRMEYILNDANLEIVLVDNDSSAIVAKHHKNLKLINVSQIKFSSSEFVFDDIKASNLACIFYTSGSTGTPKGVQIEHAGVVHLVKDSNYIEILPQDRLAQTSSFLFDASSFEIWGALLNGATLVVPPPGNILVNSARLHQFLFNEKISILFITTQLFHMYALLDGHIFRNLKYLLFGGEAVLPDIVKQFKQQKNGPDFLIHVYGPTENTTFSTAFLVDRKKEIPSILPIGKPITGTKAYVLGQHNNLLPVGTLGKLFLSGPGLARSYLNQPELNKIKFIHLFDERLYDTGDIVAWQHDGNLKFLGRQDDQIKINGYRIELSEIEANLKAHPSVEQVFVVMNSYNHHKQIAAYVVFKKGFSLSDINLQHYLLLNLPKYMIPHYYYVLDDIPLTNIGKVDKKALLKLNLKPVSVAHFEQPTTVLEKKLATAFSNILHLPFNHIGIYSEFFDLGGSSISALNLISYIEKEFELKFTFDLLYKFSSIKDLATKIQALQETNVQVSCSKHNVLKMIKAGDKNKVPIVFVHPIGGSGFCYLELIKSFSNQQPCYLIQDPSIDADQILFNDIAEIAAFYRKALEHSFERQNFILAGFSFGGMLSIEIAHQFAQKGSDGLVKGIIAFDTWVVSNFSDENAKNALKANIMNQYHSIEKILSDQNIDPKPWMKLYYHRLQNLGFSYLPPKIKKKIILFKAKEQEKEFAAMHDDTNFLNLHTTEPVEVYPINGNHNTILQWPNVQQIYKILANHDLLINDNDHVK